METLNVKSVVMIVICFIFPALLLSGNVVQGQGGDKNNITSNLPGMKANLAQANSNGLVNCGKPGADGELQEDEMCDFQDLMSLIQELINWLIGILTLVATLLFMYAGFLYLTAGGDGGQVDTAKTIFQNVAGGFVIVLLAFTLIATLVNLLTRDDWQDNWKEAIPIELSLDNKPDNHLV